MGAKVVNRYGDPGRTISRLRYQLAKLNAACTRMENEYTNGDSEAFSKEGDEVLYHLDVMVALMEGK